MLAKYVIIIYALGLAHEKRGVRGLIHPPRFINRKLSNPFGDRPPRGPYRYLNRLN